MSAGELDPGLDGQVRDRVGQQAPEPLSADQLPAGSCPDSSQRSAWQLMASPTSGSLRIWGQ
jgi:hypothetical protein